MKQTTGSTKIKFVPLGNISVYTLLDQGKVPAGDVFSTDPAQLEPKYTALVDDKHIFGFQNVAPVVKKTLAHGSNGALLASTVERRVGEADAEGDAGDEQGVLRRQGDAEADRSRLPRSERAARK